jgi:hypothetical protein
MWFIWRRHCTGSLKRHCGRSCHGGGCLGGGWVQSLDGDHDLGRHRRQRTETHIPGLDRRSLLNAAFLTAEQPADMRASEILSLTNTIGVNLRIRSWGGGRITNRLGGRKYLARVGADRESLEEKETVVINCIALARMYHKLRCGKHSRGGAD